jgi:hypothetical protein
MRDQTFVSVHHSCFFSTFAWIVLSKGLTTRNQKEEFHQEEIYTYHFMHLSSQFTVRLARNIYIFISADSRRLSRNRVFFIDPGLVEREKHYHSHV